MIDYNASAKAYWYATTLIGSAVLAFACTQIAALDASAVVQVALGAGVAAVAGLLPVRIPGTRTSVAVADVFVFLLLLHFGPAAAAVAAAAEAGAISLRTSARWTSWLGSPAMAAIAMYAAGTVFAYGTAQLLPTVASTCAMALAAALVYSVCGTLLIMSLIRLKRGEPIAPWRTVREHHWLAVGSAASASVATLLHTSFPGIDVAVMLVAVPIIAIFVAVLHVYLRHGAEGRI